MKTFGLKIVGFLTLIAALTYITATLAPEPMEDARAEYAFAG